MVKFAQTLADTEEEAAQWSITMTSFPNLYDYSPQKVKNVVKQPKTKQRPQPQDVEKMATSAAERAAPSNESTTNDRAIDLYV